MVGKFLTSDSIQRVIHPYLLHREAPDQVIDSGHCPYNSCPIRVDCVTCCTDGNLQRTMDNTKKGHSNSFCGQICKDSIWRYDTLKYGIDIDQIEVG